MPASRCVLPFAALALLVGGVVAPPSSAEAPPFAEPGAGSPIPASSGEPTFGEPAPGEPARSGADVEAGTWYRHAGSAPAADAATSDSSPAPVAGTLEVRVIDRNGDAPPTALAGYVLVLGIDEDASFTTELVDGVASIPVPAGRYSVATFIGTPENGTYSRTLAVDPLVEVTRRPGTGSGPKPYAVRLDARTARAPITVAVADRPEAERTGGTVLFSQPGPPGSTSHPWYAFDVDLAAGNYVTPTEHVPGSHLYVYSELTQHGAVESPYTYHLVSDAPGRVPAWPAFRHRTEELAALRSTLAAQGDPECAMVRVSTSLPGENVGFGGVGATRATPAEHVGYFTPGPQDWSVASHYAGPDCDWAGPTTSFRVRRSFPGATETTESWGRAPLSPALGDVEPIPDADLPYWAYARREGDDLVIDVPMVADSGRGHFGTGELYWPISGISGTTTVSVDGRRVDKSDLAGAGRFPVGPEPTTYEVETEVSRDYPWSDSSAEQRARWTFRSEHDPDAVPDALPLHVVRFDAGLDDHGRAPTGPFELGVRVEHWPGAPVGAVEDVTIEASYDEGATWHPATVTPATEGWMAELDHLAGASWVALRAHATDTDGNTVDQTIIRAYELVG